MKSTELNMFNFGDNVDRDKLFNSTLSPVCTDGDKVETTSLGIGLNIAVRHLFDKVKWAGDSR